MANTYLQTAFMIPVTPEEAALTQECFHVSSEIDCGVPGTELDAAKAYYKARSAAFRATFPIRADESDPFASFYELWDDPDFPRFDADLSIGTVDDGPGTVASISGHQVDVRAVASLIQKACPSALPFGFEWACYSDRLRPDEHGGGFFVITGTDIIGGSTGWLMSEALQSPDVKVPHPCPDSACADGPDDVSYPHIPHHLGWGVYEADGSVSNSSGRRPYQVCRHDEMALFDSDWAAQQAMLASPYRKHVLAFLKKESPDEWVDIMTGTRDGKKPD